MTRQTATAGHTNGRRLKIAGLIALAVAFLASAGLIPGVSQSHAKKKKHRLEVKDAGGYLGVYMQEMDEDLYEGLDTKVKSGVLISGVVEDSPAEEFGLEDGDIIIKFDGREVDSPSGLRRLVRDTEPGEKVTIELVRDNKTKQIDITLADRGDHAMTWVTPDVGNFDFRGPSLARFFGGRALGVNVSGLNEDLAGYFGVDENAGVLVLDVVDESTAEKAGVKAGDILTHLDNKPIESADEIRDAMSDLDDGDEVEVTVIRDKKKMNLTGEVTEQSRGNSFVLRDRGRRNFRAPRVEVFDNFDRDELREELKELRKELRELKERFEKRNSG